MLQKHQLRAVTAGLTCPPPKPKRRNLESEMQRALIRWWAGACAGFGVRECLLFSIPNGGNWDAKRGSIMKLEGQRPGAPDLMLAKIFCTHFTEGSPNRMYAGLFLELKTPTGAVSPEQFEFHKFIRAQGYRTAVCRSLEEAQKVITEYLT